MPGISGARTPEQPAGKRPCPAFFLRSGALFAILYQFRLLAGELADTPVFITALVCAFAAPWFLHKKQVSPVPAMIILILTPWAARTIVALPRLFFPGPAVPLDSLLLNLDRNNFVSLIPFYWAALGSYFSLKSRRFLRGDIIVSEILLVAIFSIARSADMEVYRWPILMIALFGGILFFQFIALMLSLPPEYRLSKYEGIRAGAVLFILVFSGSLLLLRPSQEGAINREGGLLEPKLFHFDFSQFLRLESEISMNDDLVFIIRKDAGDNHILLRRFVLSGYSGKQGFFRHGERDEKTHPQRLPETTTTLGTEPIRDYRVINQEYYLVNFDASALIAINEPALVTPYDTWDASSFSSAYAVQSYASEVSRVNLITPGRRPSPETLGLSPEEYAFYTEYGEDEEIASYARDITEGIDDYREQVYAVYRRLKYGEYRYSLKPGIAPDGDQLKYFLFDSKKGYCSYYAFSMALLLRSIGIPARVAVGFFIDPGLNTFDYYPVRSDMAHAWVEVRYPEYGWIEYDPTTAAVAADEEFRPPSGTAQETFERLMKEILDNHSRLTPREGPENERSSSILADLGKRTGRFFREHWGALCIITLSLVSILIRSGHLAVSKLYANPRKKAVHLWFHILRRCALGGYRRGTRAGEAEWANELDGILGGIYSLYQNTAAARYAPEYGAEQFALMKKQYLLFSRGYKKNVPRRRRFLGWLFPPLALFLGPSNQRGAAAGAVLLILTALAGGGINGQTQDSADRLFNNAIHAQDAELWERAIELYTKGAELYPQDRRFPWTLGNLYFSRGLYRLARDEYRKIERLSPADPDVLYRLFQTSGYLNENEISVEYLERLLVIEPENRTAISRLGWMYYKLHHLEKGEQLLRSAIERIGTDANIAMTLGTIYSDMFRYGDSKKWYLEAVRTSEALGDWEFTAVAHYNLSLLESRFYRFSEALDQTNASLMAMNRPSGRLARGELFRRRLDIPGALSEYQKAYEIDKAPLSKTDLARLCQIAGRLEEARLYAESCLALGDLSWMLNYGIDPIRYKQDLHEILFKTYSGLKKTEAAMVYGTFREWVLGLVRAGSYCFKTAVHRRLFEKYSLLTAAAYRTAPSGGENHPDALIYYYNAFKSYPGRALTYLRRAREFEVPLIPQSAPSYDTEEGILRRDGELLRRVLPRLDPVWERDTIADIYAELASLPDRRGTVEGWDAAERLYALNRGALRQRGIPLPVELNIAAESGFPGTSLNRSRTERVIRRTLRKIGFEPLTGMAEAMPGGTRFRLTINLGGTEGKPRAVCELHDGGRGIRVFRKEIPLGSLSPEDLGIFARTLGDTAFTAE
ncbi:MAG: hypothetical protein LBP32_04965 [Spirochaetaceae bacterium]|jgi:transglutaminase-like putative cysteine protease/tetratricopeptide (TPR) repeat protein|nr:hypothetical protein [Spirochaetaceae bacterium]